MKGARVIDFVVSESVCMYPQIRRERGVFLNYKIRLFVDFRETFLETGCVSTVESVNSTLERGTKKRDEGHLARSNFAGKKRGERNLDRNGEPHGESRRSVSHLQHYVTGGGRRRGGGDGWYSFEK